jgi:hypothetical protein
MFDFLNDNDPKIVCQAIRGLLVFGSDKDALSYTETYDFLKNTV